MRDICYLDRYDGDRLIYMMIYRYIYIGLDYRDNRQINIVDVIMMI